jgi:RNA-directed DNA polymerase
VIPLLSFVVFPEYRLVKARKVRYATRRLGERYQTYQAGTIPFAEFEASVRGWINHVGHADSWGLRQHMLDPFILNPGDVPRRKSTSRPEKKPPAPLRGAQ